MDIKNTIIVILVIILISVFGYFVFFDEREPEELIDENSEEIIEEENGEEENEKEETVEEKTVKEIILNYLNYPYKRSPLNEEEGNIYRNDVFDSTTLVLTVAADYHFPEDPEEGMKKIHYFPPGEVSYENRLHFSSYRNKVSDYFTDITREIAGDYFDYKTILLNRREDEDRLIDIDWEEEISLDFVKKEDISSVLINLPEVVGVMFLVRGDEKIGLDVRHEGFILNQTDFVHVSSAKEMVIMEDFKEFLDGSGFYAVNFFEIK